MCNFRATVVGADGSYWTDVRSDLLRVVDGIVSVVVETPIVPTAASTSATSNPGLVDEVKSRPRVRSYFQLGLPKAILYCN